jgi:hypothetical protein
MHGLDAKPKDPRGTITTVIAVILSLYLLAVSAYNIWDAFK